MREGTVGAELRAGWLVLVACAVGVGSSAVALPFYSIGPLTKPIETAMGWTRSDIQLAILFSSGIGALTSPVVGWLIGRFGPRRVAIPSLVGVSTGLTIASMADSLGQFWAGYALAAILGAGSNPVLWSRVIAATFDRARGAALGLALVGTALVALLLPNLIAIAVPELGWAGALRLVAAIPVVLALPIVGLFLPRGQAGHSSHPAREQSGFAVREALTDRRFWFLTASILCGYLAISGVSPNLVPALSDRGFDPADAARIASFFAVGMIPGRIASGFLMDRFWAPMVACGALILPAFACLMFNGSDNPAILAGGCMMLGIAAGAELDILAFLTVRYFGLRRYPQIYSFSYAALAIGSATAPTMFSRIFERTASYEASFGIAAVLFLAGATLVVLLGPYPDHGQDSHAAA